MAHTYQILSLTLVFAVAGCSMIEVSTDYDASIDFERLATYDWLPEPHKPTGDPRIDNPLLEKRIRTAVESQLAAKGYEKAGAGRADFLVGYHAAIDRRLSVQSMNTYYGYRSGWGWDDYRYGDGWGYHRAWKSEPMFRTYTRYYDEGSLILDFVTPQTRELIWRGAAKAEVDEADSPRTKREQINEAVRRILEQFPPMKR